MSMVRMTVPVSVIMPVTMAVAGSVRDHDHGMVAHPFQQPGHVVADLLGIPLVLDQQLQRLLHQLVGQMSRR